MSKILPQYLYNISTEIKERGHSVSFNAKCPCGNPGFELFKKKKTEKEIEAEKKWNDLGRQYNSGCCTDRKGNIYLYKRKFFGLKKDKMLVTREDIPTHVEIIKIRCCNCGKEYVLFDSRCHGYDGLVDMLEGKVFEDCNIQFKKIEKASEQDIIQVVITNEVSYEEFLEEFGSGRTSEEYASAFTGIAINIISNGKKKKIFSFETA